ncbi:MAG: polysaccharide export protein [Anaerolineae bacterium]|nr:polysaccharide export protein [Anaerolineae bacterium]
MRPNLIIQRYCTALGILLVTLSVLCSPAAAQGGNYRIQAEDVLKITVYEHDDLETRARVSSNGEISFPLLEKVQVADRTVQEIEQKLTTALEKDYLVSAQVQVFIEEYHAKQVTVLGAVEKPGRYEIHREKETTVLEAIAMAGGFTKVASQNGTRIIRTRDDKEEAIPIRVTDITKKGKQEQNIIVQAGDIVYVPESFF